jgi:transglutaminase/protease-like cytokinesis protein 3
MFQKSLKVSFIQFFLILYILARSSLSKYINKYNFEKRNDINFTNKKIKLIPIKYWPNAEKEQLKSYNITDNDNEDVNISAVFSSAKFNFYNQLDDTEKPIYDIIYESCMKSQPDFEITTNIETSTKSLENFEEELLIKLEKIFTILLIENPDIWWIDYFSFSYDTYDFINYEICIYLHERDSLFYNYTSEDISNLNKEIDIVKNKIMYQIKQIGLTTPYAILRYIHDYLITNIVYTLDENREHIRNIYGALVENKCVCEGYAEAIQYIARQYNINCIIAYSSSHEWNFVEMDNKWYIIDVTYDDPIINGIYYPSGSNENLQTDFFLIGTEHIDTEGQKYSEDPNRILMYSEFSNQKLISYPSIETTDYIPNEKELQELELIQNYSFPENEVLTNTPTENQILTNTPTENQIPTNTPTENQTIIPTNMNNKEDYTLTDIEHEIPTETMILPTNTNTEIFKSEIDDLTYKNEKDNESINNSVSLKFSISLFIIIILFI